MPYVLTTERHRVQGTRWRRTGSPGEVSEHAETLRAGDRRALVLSFREGIDIAKQLAEEFPSLADGLRRSGAVIRLTDARDDDVLKHLAICPGCHKCFRFSFERLLFMARRRSRQRRTAARPVVWVLDDYNNFIVGGGGLFWPKAIDSKSRDEAARAYFPNATDGSSVALFDTALSVYCGILRGLGDTFDVRAPILGYGSVGVGGAGAAPGSIPLALFDAERDQTAAFLVDLEWTADRERPQRIKEGVGALQLLRRRYPEVPRFVLTGKWSIDGLQEALSYGADWCFWKPKSHHAQDEKSTSDELGEHQLANQKLTSEAFNRHLCDLQQAHRGAFADSQLPADLSIDTSTDAGRSLLKKLGIRAPLAMSSRGRNLLRLLASLFPDASEIRPVQMIGTGRSKAKATFLVSTRRGSDNGATRFVKVASWPIISQEYRGYAQVIRPHLNSYTATALDEPVFSSSDDGAIRDGAIAYTLAGFPEGYDSLRSLDRLVADIATSGEQNLTAAAARAIAALSQTLDVVLRPLHVAGRSEVREVRRPLWAWLGRVLPPFRTGELLKAEVEPGYRLASYRPRGFKDSGAWALASRDLVELPADGETALVGFHLEEVSWDTEGDGQGEVVVRHPDLGLRIKLRGKADSIRDQFDEPWIRPGLPVDVIAALDKENSAYAEISRRIENAFSACWPDGAVTGCLTDLEDLVKAAGKPLIDPISLLSGEGALPADFTVKAKEGAIHGDLNLNNILFAPTETGPGWLIDFELADGRGMLAFDVAKLQVEIAQKHLIPELHRISELLRLAPAQRLALGCAAWNALECGGDVAIAFEAMAKQHCAEFSASPELLRPARELLRVMAVSGDYAAQVKLARSELAWALGWYALVASKFVKDSSPWYVVHLAVMAAWHLTEVIAPLSSSDRNAAKSVLEDLASAATPVPDPRIDAGLLALRRARYPISELTPLVGAVTRERQPDWEADAPERWDLASTGSVANISPLMSYLWLMTRATPGVSGAPMIYVPKISTQGASCGTVDVLESGGYRFTSNPKEIVRRCEESGGVLCRQDKSLTPVDTALMRRRKATNGMKDFGLTVASILGKKIAMGCTHVVVDVKLGRDSKIVPDTSACDAGRSLLSCGMRELCATGDQYEQFRKLLCDRGVEGDQLNVTPLAGGWQVLDQTAPDELAPLKKIRWLLTNSDVPQCRAVGRHLMLLHIEGLVRGGYQVGGKLHPETLLEVGEYGTLYCDVLPTLCGAGACSPDSIAANLGAPWSELRTQLKKADGTPARTRMDLWLACGQEWFEQPRDVVSPEEDLKVVTLAPGRYTSAALRETTVRAVDAVELDCFFDWLCGAEPFDNEVGLWMHQLPNERFSAEGAALSVFFRPSRTAAQEVLQRARGFLRDHFSVDGTGGA